LNVERKSKEAAVVVKESQPDPLVMF